MNRHSHSGLTQRLSELSSLVGGNPGQMRKMLQSLGIRVSETEFNEMTKAALYEEEAFGEEEEVDDDAVLSLADRWSEKFEALFHAAPDNLVADSREFPFEVTEMYGTGEFHGICRDEGKVYPVFAKAFLDDPPAGCGCPESRGRHACVHAVKFVEYLSDELDEPNSKLHRRVLAERFSRGKPDYEKSQPDPAAKLLQQFDLVIGTGRATEPLENDVIAQRTAPVDNRLAWRVEADARGIDLYPISQQPKKRGDGYTKGRRLKLESAMRDRELHRTSQDRRVIECIEYQASYYSYRQEAELDTFEAMRTLIGAPNVFFDKDSVSVRKDDFEFEVMLVDDQYILLKLLAADDAVTKQGERQRAIYYHRAKLAGEALPPTIQTFTNRSGWMIRTDQARNLVSLVEFNPDDEQLMLTLLQFPGIAAEHGGELVKRLQPIQSRITISLPEALLGPIVDVPAQPVVLLRSNKDGSLDVALRIRDHQGRVRMPGSPPAISISDQDGIPVQYRRDVAHELKLSARLAKTLGFDDSPSDDDLQEERFATHISDFGTGLDVIERLQSWATASDQPGHNDSDLGDMLAPEVLWDRNSEKPMAVLGTISSQNVRVEINRKRDWFGISGQCEVGGRKLDLGELMENLAVENPNDVHGDFVRLKDGQWARIGEKLRNRLRKLRDATHADRKTMRLDATSAPAIRDFLDDTEIQHKAVKAWQQCLDRLARAENLDPQLPEGLDAELRDYQIEGYRWLRRLAEWGVGGILADDMGLGKTLQTLAVLLDRKDVGPTLVIAPTSVGFNWVREAERFTPGLSVHLYRETDRAEFLQTVGPGDLVVCSYGLALRDNTALAKVEWGTLVLDEAQAIKNSRSKTSKAIADIPAQWTVALTGTPVENHLGELWSLFHVVSPGVFGGWEQFRKRFAIPIEKNNLASASAGLADRLKPFVLRRKKSEVLRDLPPRTEMNLYVDLSKEERAEYERVRLEAIGEVDQLEATVTTQDQRFRILALLTRLRQISCHPKLVNKSYTGEASKLLQLRETLSNLREEGHRALIFSQFTQHLALIREELEATGFTYEYLDGSTPAQARQQRVDAFQNGTADVFLISLKAGGTGLNLTAADYVIHMDPWWNPAVEDQATDRAHRIGQEKPVMVYRIIARGTIEEEILALHESKRDLVAGVLEGTAAAAKLNNNELVAMLRKGV